MMVVNSPSHTKKNRHESNLVPVHLVGACEDRFGKAWFCIAR